MRTATATNDTVQYIWSTVRTKESTLCQEEHASNLDSITIHHHISTPNHGKNQKTSREITQSVQDDMFRHTTTKLLPAVDATALCSNGLPEQ